MPLTFFEGHFVSNHPRVMSHQASSSWPSPSPDSGLFQILLGRPLHLWEGRYLQRRRDTSVWQYLNTPSLLCEALLVLLNHFWWHNITHCWHRPSDSTWPVSDHCKPCTGGLLCDGRTASHRPRDCVGAFRDLWEDGGGAVPDDGWGVRGQDEDQSQDLKVMMTGSVSLSWI